MRKVKVFSAVCMLVVLFGCATGSSVLDEVLSNNHFKTGTIVSVGYVFSVQNWTQLTYSDETILLLVVPVVPDSWYKNEVSTINYQTIDDYLGLGVKCNVFVVIMEGGIISTE